MHLVQRSNTLGAEIELAAAATIVRRRGGAPITEAQELIACGQYGEAAAAQRSAHRRAGQRAGAREADITLANPVGLYIAGLSVAGWLTPDGSDPAGFWTITRGTKEKALRAVYEVPAGRGFVVGDIKINGKPIEFGAQIADFIRIKLTGLATRLGQSTVAPMNGCVEPAVAGRGDPGARPAAASAAAESGRRARPPGPVGQSLTGEPVMALILDRRDGISEPAGHAFIVGLSGYPHLPVSETSKENVACLC